MNIAVVVGYCIGSVVVAALLIHTRSAEKALEQRRECDGGERDERSKEDAEPLATRILRSPAFKGFLFGLLGGMLCCLASFLLDALL